MLGQKSPLRELSSLLLLSDLQEFSAQASKPHERKANARNWKMSPRAIRLMTLWLIVAAMLTVTGCENGSVVKSGCEWSRPIYPTKADVDVISDSLVTQIVEHNETRAKICGGS